MPADVELREPIERAMGYVERWAAPLAELDPAAAVAAGDDRYIAEDLTHNAGRALDALLKGREVTGRAIDGTVLAALRRVLFATLDNPTGFPAAWSRLADFYYDGQKSRNDLLAAQHPRGGAGARGAVPRRRRPGGAAPARYAARLPAGDHRRRRPVPRRPDRGGAVAERRGSVRRPSGDRRVLPVLHAEPGPADHGAHPGVPGARRPARPGAGAALRPPGARGGVRRGRPPDPPRRQSHPLDHRHRARAGRLGTAGRRSGHPRPRPPHHAGGAAADLLQLRLVDRGARGGR